VNDRQFIWEEETVYLLNGLRTYLYRVPMNLMKKYEQLLMYESLRRLLPENGLIDDVFGLCGSSYITLPGRLNEEKRIYRGISHIDVECIISIRKTNINN
jgi:hypothetical protein